MLTIIDQINFLDFSDCKLRFSVVPEAVDLKISSTWSSIKAVSSLPSNVEVSVKDVTNSNESNSESFSRDGGAIKDDEELIFRQSKYFMQSKAEIVETLTNCTQHYNNSGMKVLNRGILVEKYEGNGNPYFIDQVGKGLRRERTGSVFCV